MVVSTEPTVPDGPAALNGALMRINSMQLTALRAAADAER